MSIKTNEHRDREIPPEIWADLEEVVRQAATGAVRDPELLRRVQERSENARREMREKFGVREIGVQLIREARGPLDDEQERELTLTQRELVRRGELRLVDPDTGTSYVLVPEEEYKRLRGQ